MKILVTGAKGFVGRNLCAQLNNIKEGKARCYGDVTVEAVFEYDLDSTPEQLDAWCAEADFVFNLAGVNRPQNQEEFMKGNFGFASTLLDTLRKHNNTCPVMLSSSQQASLTGRFGNSEYGRSKKAGEDLFLQYGEEIAGRAGNDERGTCNDDDRHARLDRASLGNDVDRHALNDDGRHALNDDDRHARLDRASLGNDADRHARLDRASLGNDVDRHARLEALNDDDRHARLDRASLGNDDDRHARLDRASLGKDACAPGLRPRVLVYRFPNLFGKWCRPNYNSAVATFCNAVANDLPYTVNDPSVELELLYIDDLVDEMIACLRGEEHRCEFDGLGVFPMEDGRYCYVPTTHKATLGDIVDLLNKFAEQPRTLMIPEIPANSFAKKLYSTYLSYLPKEKVAFPLKMNVDDRGSFTELVHTLNCGQVSINISKPGITKGQHWHNTKWEFFIVVSGHGLIQERRLGSDEVIEFEVSGDNIQAVHMLPGCTHNIINLSQTENLVTVMYCNEVFDPNKPDTYFEKV